MPFLVAWFPICISMDQEICIAASHGDCGQIERLFVQGASVNCTSSDGFTPLCLAIIASKYNAVQLLLERGAKVSCRCGGLTPLQYATNMHDWTSDQFNICLLLIQNGCSTDAFFKRDTSSKDFPLVSMVKAAACCKDNMDTLAQALHPRLGIESQARFLAGRNEVMGIISTYLFKLYLNDFAT